MTILEFVSGFILASALWELLKVLYDSLWELSGKTDLVRQTNVIRRLHAACNERKTKADRKTRKRSRKVPKQKS